MPFAQDGVVVDDSVNVAIQGVKPAGLAAQGNVIWTPRVGPWAVISTMHWPLLVQSPVFDSTGANFLLAALASFNGSPTSIADTLGNVWNLGVTAGIAGNIRSAIFWCKPSTVGSGHRLTPVGVGVQYCGSCVAAFRGPAVNLDQALGAGTAAASSPGIITPSGANALVVTSISGGVTPTTLNDPTFIALVISPFVSGQAQSSGLAYQVQTTPTAVNPTWNGFTSGSRTAAIMSFLPA